MGDRCAVGCVHDRVQRLSLPLFTWVFDLPACLILPVALATMDRPGAVIVAKRIRCDADTACQALALAGVLQAVFTHESSGTGRAKQWALVRRICARLAQDRLG